MDNFLEMSEMDYIKVESEVYQKEQENIKYYETAIRLIEEIDVPTNSARIKMNGKDVWVFSTHLYEVSNN